MNELARAHRLKVVELRLPPLRERKDDVLPLATLLLGTVAAHLERPWSASRRQWPTCWFGTSGLAPYASSRTPFYALRGGLRGRLGPPSVRLLG